MLKTVGFLDQQDAFDDLRGGIQRLSQLSKRNVDKSMFPLMVIFGAHGSGKTAFFHHLMHMPGEQMVSLLPAALQDKPVVFLFANFSSTTTTYNCEYDRNISSSTCASFCPFVQT
eukprot:PhF_6_TR5510/c2_g1_i2/m.7807